MNGIWIRLGRRFNPRANEWLLSWIMFGWGVSLVLWPETFDGKSWTIFKSIYPPFIWGFIFAATGSVALIALFINGSRKEITPWFRLGAAIIRLFAWGGIWTAFFFAYNPGPWVFVYSAFFAAEWHNLWKAAYDAGAANATEVSRPLKSSY